MNENEIKTKSSLGIAALTLGIISVVSTLFWYITIPTGILSIVLGRKAISRVGSKIGKAGFILGIVGLSIFAFIYLSMIAVMLIGIYL